MTRLLLLVLADFAAAFLIAFAVNCLAGMKWRRARSAHWAERARLLWPVRRSAAANVFLVPACFGILQFALDGRFSYGCMAAAVAAWMGVLVGTYRLDREIFPSFSFAQWLRLVVIAWSLRLMLFLVWGGSAFLMPDRIDGWTFFIAGCVLTFHVALNWRLWRSVLAHAGMLVPADDRLRAIVVATSERMKLLPPGVWLLNVPVANAAALPLTRELLFTTGLMEVCTDEEVSGICAHELAHLKEPKYVLVLRVIGSLPLFPLLFLRPALHAYGDAGFVLVLLSFMLMLLRITLGRRMEKSADKSAVEQQHTAGVYARALENIYRKNQAPAVNESRRKIHPHLYDRLLAAGIQPDFERPKPPQAIAGIYLVLWLGFGVLIGWAMARSGF